MKANLQRYIQSHNNKQIHATHTYDERKTHKKTPTHTHTQTNKTHKIKTKTHTYGHTHT